MQMGAVDAPLELLGATAFTKSVSHGLKFDGPLELKPGSRELLQKEGCA